MPITLAQINAQIDTLLDDEGRSSYPAALRLAAINRAMDHFAVTHTALIKRQGLTPTRLLDETKMPLPEDYISPIAFWSGGEMWHIAGEVGDNPGASKRVMRFGNDLYAFKVSVTSPTLWYYALYPRMVNDSDTFPVPMWAEWGVINLALVYILYPDMVGQASLRRFQTRRESGTPEDNPPRAQARFHYDIYRDIVNRVKPQDRTPLQVI